MRKNRSYSELREIEFIPNINKYAKGSCLAKIGNTHVLCTATIEDRVPLWLKNKGRGWVTAEYGMLPHSTHSRIEREATRGKQSGRTQEIQRLIGRSLRSIMDLGRLGERQIKIDCDVIQADGGTRTAAINGGFIALAISVKKFSSSYNIKDKIIKEHVAAISCGIVKGEIFVDLDYDEDSNAEVDANFVMSESDKFIEIQSTAETKTFSEKQLNEMLALSSESIRKIISYQKEILKNFV